MDGSIVQETSITITQIINLCLRYRKFCNQCYHQTNTIMHRDG